MDPARTRTKEETAAARLICGECGKPLEFGKDDPVTGLLFRGARCTCIDRAAAKAADNAAVANASVANGGAAHASVGNAAAANAAAANARLANASVVNTGSRAGVASRRSAASTAAAMNAEELAARLQQAQSLLGERYEVLSLLGEGGMAAVYRVRDKELDKIFAIKILQEQLVKDQPALRRFRQEAVAAQSLTHANVAAIYGHGVSEQGAPYIVMDCLDGKDLTTLLDEEGPMHPQRALLLFHQLAEAMAHAHAKGVVHRDLKPSNIIVQSANGVDIPKIVDFGIAKVVTAENRPTQQLTQTGEIFGSPLYMSPEQCVGNEQDARTDIYALGCVMYEVLTGEPPFVGENPVKTVLKHIQEEPVPPSAKAPCTPVALEKIILHCLEKQPGDRYQSASELAVDLQKVIDNRPIELRKPTVKIEAARRRKRMLRQALFTMVSSVVLALALVTFFSDPHANKTAQQLLLEGYMKENGAGIGGPDYKDAMAMYKRAQEKGSTEALVSQALLYSDGKGVERDYAKAAKLYEEAVARGNSLAMHNLALLYENGQGVEQSYERAMQLYQQAAKQNNAGSQMNIASLYANGRGVPRDYKKAFEWASKSAEAGVAKAEKALGMHYEFGLGVPKDAKLAIKWYTRAVQHGDNSALLGLGDVYGFLLKPPDYELAMHNYERAAEWGDLTALIHIGQLYESGLGVPKDYKKAADCYLKAAEQNYSGAFWQLERVYRLGRGVPKDPAKARYWDEKAKEAAQWQDQDALPKPYSQMQQEDSEQDRPSAQWFRKTRETADDPHYAQPQSQ